LIGEKAHLPPRGRCTQDAAGLMVPRAHQAAGASVEESDARRPTPPDMKISPFVMGGA
jgi:hypothetical protein